MLSGAPATAQPTEAWSDSSLAAKTSCGAALKLHVSQPALSKQIRDLEDEIGFSLLERTAKSVQLTAAGRAFLDNARALLQNADEAVTKARAVASAEPTELHVGYSPTPVAEILPKTLRAFQHAMPNIRVRLHDWSNKAILDGIRDGRLQLGLIVPPAKASALQDMRYEELFHERVCVAIAPRRSREQTASLASALLFYSL
jgi:DNA-binding transcriptional LysR family regulator